MFPLGTRQADRRLLLAVFVAVALLGTVFFLVSTPHGGVAITPDSLHYLAASQSLLHGDEFLRYDDRPYVYWPPLFPILLAAIGEAGKVVGLDLVTSARYLQLATYILLLVASAALFFRTLRSRVMALLATLAAVLGVPLLVVSVFVWSEPLFSVFIVLFFLYLPTYLDRPSLKRVAVLAFIVGLASLQRLVGYSLFFAAAGILLLLTRLPLRRRLAHVAVLAVIVAVMVGPWLLRNVARTGTLAGTRYDPIQTFEGALMGTAGAVAQWFAPVPQEESQAVFITVVVLLAFAAVLALLSWRRSDTGMGPGRARVPLGMGLFALVYLVMLFISSRVTNHELGLRLVEPAYVPFIGAVFAALEYGGYRLGRRLQRAALVMAVVTGAILLWMVYPASQLLANIRALDWCCHYDQWAHSATVRWLQTHPLDGPIYSNTPIPLYMGVYLHKAPPRERALVRLLREQAVYFVWFSDQYQYTCMANATYCYNTEYTPDALDERTMVELVADLADGRVYHLSAADP